MAYLDKFSLAGKVALVTGGAYGIGFAIARALAKTGAQIAFNCRRQAHLEQALANYRAEGIEAHGYIADVTDEAQVTELVKTIEKELGVVDILVNNAGIIKRIPMIEMSVADFRQVVDIDLTAPFIVAKAVLPGMIQKGHGKIINICSMMSELGRETVSAYAAAKGGLKMLTRNICSEYGGGGRISSATASDRAILRLPRPRLCGKNNRMAAPILSISSLLPKRRRPVGAHRKIWKVRLSFWRRTLPTL